jgi:hypothetical protein
MKFSKAALFVSFAFSGAVFAQEVAVVGSLQQTVHVPAFSQQAKSKVQFFNKKITLLKIHLSDKAREAINLRSEQDAQESSGALVNGEESNSVQLGMNNVPVLDQGGHGTCATFANTAAVDAVINKGDYISQLCNLQLGRFFENNAYSPSGWNGSLGRIVLSQMDAFGIVSLQNQKTQGCGGLTAYPLYGSDPEGEISLADFHKMSEPLEDYGVYWSPILDIYQFFVDHTNTTKTLEEVKMSIRSGDRVTFGVLLPDYHLGVVGAVGRNHVRNDTWVLTPEIEQDIPVAEAAHEMIITGFDDDAVAKDDQGREYKGILTLRNSWGSNIGDKGDFYMTYDYFKALVIEAQRIRHTS